MVRQFFFVAFAKRSKSSAKNKCEKIDPSLDVLMPVQFSQEFSVSMREARYSMQRINKYGEKGSPWRMPLDGENDSVLSPLTSTERLEEVMHDMIRSTQSFGNLNQHRTW